MKTWLRVLTMGLSLAWLTGCENNAASFMINGKEHALTLVREQPYFWDSRVDQFLVVSRLPDCQRRYPVMAGQAGRLDVELYLAGNLLWALRQGPDWYLASTERCQLQAWTDKPDNDPPGPLEGRFVWRDGPFFELEPLDALEGEAAVPAGAR